MDLFEDSNQDAIQRAMPLAARMRPRSLDEFEGQEELLAPGRALRVRIEQDVPGNIILWGPPGTGKTTLAEIIARTTGAAFVRFNAAAEGVPRIREVAKEAETRLRTEGRRTTLFIDEIHRLNKAQQDVLLPLTEVGTLAVIGATTENPSFEVNRALLSRAQVFVLRSLSEESVQRTLVRALKDSERGLGRRKLKASVDVLKFVARLSGGDIRRALTILEVAAAFAPDEGFISESFVREAAGAHLLRHDKDGDAHYDLASAFQKSIRGSDADAACYYLSRMLVGGDASMAMRRIRVIAAEDIGMADPQAVVIAQAGCEAYAAVGSPEGDIILNQVVVYLATAPKSNRSYLAMHAARAALEEMPQAEIPMHIRNAPTALMKELGYKKGYENPQMMPEHFSVQPYLPEPLQGRIFYEPSQFGYEKEVAKRVEWWRRRRDGATEQK